MGDSSSSRFTNRLPLIVRNPQHKTDGWAHGWKKGRSDCPIIVLG